MKVLITGAASGIGAACVEAFSMNNELVLIDRSPIAERPNARLFKADVSDEAFWLSPDLQSALGDIDHAIFCAGVSDAAPIVQMDYQAWSRILSVNLDGVFLGIRAVLRAKTTPGAIVAVSSASARKPAAMTSAYGASKAALEQLVRVAALEASTKGIRVNAVAPGGVQTPMFSDQDWFRELCTSEGSQAGAWAKLAEGTPSGRFSRAEEVAELIRMLVSPAAEQITGAVLACDGGYTLT